MERSDKELIEGIETGNQDALTEVLDEFEHGDRRAYNLLVQMLKSSEPSVERALRRSFVDGDGLVIELVCQAYYPFVEALCNYKFKGKSPQEITDFTSRILSDFVKSAPKIPSNVTMKNSLYQRVCACYKDYLNSESVNSFGHEVAERKSEVPNATIENVKAATVKSSEDTPPAPEEVQAEPEPMPQVAQAAALASDLPMPRRHGSSSSTSPAPKVVSAQLEETAAKAVAAAAANFSKIAPKTESVLPPIESDKKSNAPRVAGYPSESHEAKNTSPYSAKLSKAMARMAERDFDTYQTIVMHYFGRKGYQQLCKDLGNLNIVDVGRTLCRGLLDLGREIFGL